ncbi:unnamed protein product [Adineta steineri]|uniref:G-protein coupled receptors family 1 profile domain-containing protein n=1 Tax=Adineta steineri TaxID=433720 RepID=A0A814J8U1_9BILA|nr:unnamed protein product [Adineta steineri]CAF3915732.1 unnamed protein product [Adineta steineri]
MSLHILITVPFVKIVGLIFLVSGLFGNLFNIIIFIKNSINNSSTYLLFLSSLFSLIYLLDGLFTRILSVGFNIDPTRTNLIWCKTRTYIGQTTSLISLTCICYALLDQLFLSCQKQKYRRLSQLKRTKFITLIIILFWFIYHLPFYILAQHVNHGNNTFICNIYAIYEFNKYFSYIHQPIIAGIIPILFIIITGTLMYQNISLLRKNRRRDRAQRNLTTMIVVQTIFIIIQSVPYGFYSMYLSISSYEYKSIYRQDMESVILNLVSILYYFSHCFSFLIYYISSVTYRQQTKQLLIKIFTHYTNTIIS